MWHCSPALGSCTSLSLALGWYAQSDWPAADGQAPGRVARGPFLAVRVEGPQWSVLQTSSSRLRPGQETFLLFQKELSPIGPGPEHSILRQTSREWHHSTGVAAQPKTGSGTHTEVWGRGGGGHFALYLSHYSSLYWLIGGFWQWEMKI